MKNRQDIAFEFMKDTKGKFLDIGCGLGAMSSRLANVGNEVTAIDMLSGEIKKAKIKCKGKNVKFKVMDANNLNFPANYFDGVIFLETIEHVENPVKVLRDIQRILKPNGSLVLSTPNIASYSSFIKQLFFNKKYLWKIEKEPKDTGTNYDHLYAWDISTLYRLLYKCGFEYDKHAFSAVYGVGPFKKLSWCPLSPLFGKFREIMIIKVKKQKR